MMLCIALCADYGFKFQTADEAAKQATADKKAADKVAEDKKTADKAAADAKLY